jgi:hypothetical protein
MAPGIQHDEWRNRRRHLDSTGVGNLPEFVSESRHRSGYERRLLAQMRSTARRRATASAKYRPCLNAFLFTPWSWGRTAAGAVKKVTAERPRTLGMASRARGRNEGARAGDFFLKARKRAYRSPSLLHAAAALSRSRRAVISFLTSDSSATEHCDAARIDSGTVFARSLSACPCGVRAINT